MIESLDEMVNIFDRVVYRVGVEGKYDVLSNYHWYLTRDDDSDDEHSAVFDQLAEQARFGRGAAERSCFTSVPPTISDLDDLPEVCTDSFAAMTTKSFEPLETDGFCEAMIVDGALLRLDFYGPHGAVWLSPYYVLPLLAHGYTFAVQPGESSMVAIMRNGELVGGLAPMGDPDETGKVANW